MSKLLTTRDYKNILIQESPVIDVRAPVEFVTGAFPGAVNLPLMFDEERKKIGICYKQQGREAAIGLGYKIVSGENQKTKIQNWLQFIREHNQPVYLTCYRGGLRSQISHQWIAENQAEVIRFEKGYKDYRQWSVSETQKYFLENRLLVLTGATGSGKTDFLRAVKNYPTLDLEKLANHRGSAFGSMVRPQPSQSDFENHILKSILLSTADSQIESTLRPLLVEDESRVIGSLHLTEELFQNIRSQPVIFLETDFESRVKNIFNEYITEAVRETQLDQLLDKYQQNIIKISKRLGSQRALEIGGLLKNAQSADFSEHCGWIERLLSWYYDPLYNDSLIRRRVPFQFKGNAQAIQDFLLAK